MPSKWRWAFAAWLLIVVIIAIIAYLYRIEIGDEMLLALGGAIIVISAAIIGYYLNSNKEKVELTPLELEIKRGKMLIERQFLGTLRIMLFSSKGSIETIPLGIELLKSAYSIKTPK